MYYFEILDGLFRRKIRYLLIGGLGVNLYGVPRVTQDIDLIVSMDRGNVLGLIALMKELGFAPRLPVDPEKLADPAEVKDWIENRNLKAFSFIHRKEAFKVVDIVLVHPLDFEKAYDRKTVKRARGTEISLASMDDLITCKQFSGRPQDLSDIALLLKAKRFLQEEA